MNDGSPTAEVDDILIPPWRVRARSEIDPDLAAELDKAPMIAVVFFSASYALTELLHVGDRAFPVTPEDFKATLGFQFTSHELEELCAL